MNHAVPPAQENARDFLIILARWPQHGGGKTRLAATLGTDAAHELERAFLADTLGWARTHRPVLVAFTPEQSGVEFEQAVPGAHLVAQSAGSLGERITAAFDQAFALQARRAVIVGSDSPTLPAPILEACFEGLGSADVTLVPTEDGGFAAMGLSRPQPRLFDQVAWSTNQALHDVCVNAAKAELAVALMPAWYDVDDGLGLGRLAADLSGYDRAPATAAMLTALGLMDSSVRSRRQ